MTRTSVRVPNEYYWRQDVSMGWGIGFRVCLLVVVMLQLLLQVVLGTGQRPPPPKHHNLGKRAQQPKPKLEATCEMLKNCYSIKYIKYTVLDIL